VKKKTLTLFLLLFSCALVRSAQELTVREIMAEPSIAGMRPEGEKLSPDGSKVIFLWNAEGKCRGTCIWFRRQAERRKSY
jgi:hypothetical protein